MKITDPKPIHILFSFLLIGLLLGAPAALAQEEDPAPPKISISLPGDEEPAEKPAGEAPATPAPVATTPTPAEQPAEEKKPIFTREEQLFLIYAYYLVFSNRIDMIELSDQEKKAFLVGINLGLQNSQLTGWEERIPEVRKLIDERWAPVYKRLQRERKASTVELFADLANREEIVKTQSGLFYELISEGTGKFPTDNDVVNAEFNGKLIDGTVFETTEGSGPTALVMQSMVPGVREGLKYVREGGIIKLWVPSELGFGNEERQGLPADSALLFEFTIHEVAPMPEVKE